MSCQVIRPDATLFRVAYIREHRLKPGEMKGTRAACGPTRAPLCWHYSQVYLVYDIDDQTHRVLQTDDINL